MDSPSTTFNHEDCLSALRGERVPQILESFVAQLCVIRGIRRHPGFATELAKTSAKFARALNARAIMSNSIPDIKNDDEFPYCIWYPTVASENTYRQLVERYPQMKFLVGRACAVAGYTTLYNELDLLPEVHIAEEARDNGSTAIFDAIMAHPTKYAVMSDYDRRMQSEPQVMPLNGDTAVRSSLDTRVQLKSSYGEYRPQESEFTSYFNITEDFGIDETEHSVPEKNPEVLRSLLYTPLPTDLPAVNKDLLIAMAAYYGDVDRYSRLRRPEPVETELPCVVHGIYTNTMFAKWWSLQLPPPQEKQDNDDDDSDDDEDEETDESTNPPWYIDELPIIRAITARFIMVNDLSRISSRSNPYDLPYTIWDPLLPLEETLAELVHRRPDMTPQVARACIKADYHSLYKTLDPDASETLINQARLSQNEFYVRHLEAKAEEGKGKLGFDRKVDDVQWHRLTGEKPTQVGALDVRGELSPALFQAHFETLFEGQGVDPSIVELNACLPLELRANPPSYLRKG